MTYAGDEEIFSWWRNDLEARQWGPTLVAAVSSIPRSVSDAVYWVVHLFSGHRREGDFEWYLLRLGGAKGMRVLCENYDVVYGPHDDLGDATVISDLKARIKEKKVDGVMSGPPSLLYLVTVAVQARRPSPCARPIPPVGPTGPLTGRARVCLAPQSTSPIPGK